MRRQVPFRKPFPHVRRKQYPLLRLVPAKCCRHLFNPIVPNIPIISNPFLRRRLLAGELAGDGLKVSYGKAHPCDLAALEHKRCVFAVEVAGGQWDIARIKSLTGDSQVTARLMRQDFRTWPRQFKLTITGNQMPSIKHVDPALRRRFLLVQFNRHFSEAEADGQLGEKLKAEAGYVLWWIIQGAAKWYRNRLKAIPDQIRRDTTEYMASEDLPAMWLDDACEIGPGKYEESNKLYRSFTDWCEQEGTTPGMNSNAFGRWLTTREFTQDRLHGVRIRRGLELRATD